jgi:CRP/FNR family transcriptional regulator, cyclic AMP receptor protein
MTFDAWRMRVIKNHFWQSLLEKARWRRRRGQEGAAATPAPRQSFHAGPELHLTPAVGANLDHQIALVGEMLKAAARSAGEHQVFADEGKGGPIASSSLEHALALYTQALAILHRTSGLAGIFQENGFLRRDPEFPSGQDGDATKRLVRLAYDAYIAQAAVLWRLGRFPEAAQAYGRGASIETNGDELDICSVSSRANACALGFAASRKDGHSGEASAGSRWEMIVDARACAERLVASGESLGPEEAWGVAFVSALSQSGSDARERVANRIYDYGCKAPASEVMQKLRAVRNLEREGQSAADPMAEKLQWIAGQLELCVHRTDKALPTLRSCPLFSALDDAQLTAVIEASRIRSFPENTTVFDEGDLGNAAYVVLDGSLDICIPGPSGYDTVARIGTGGVLGEIAAFAAIPRTASAVVTEAAALLEIEQSTIATLAEATPAIANNVVKELGARLRQQNTAIGLISEAIKAIGQREMSHAILEALRRAEDAHEELGHVYKWLAETIATSGLEKIEGMGSVGKAANWFRGAGDMLDTQSGLRIVTVRAENDDPPTIALEVFSRSDGTLNLLVMAAPDTNPRYGGLLEILSGVTRALALDEYGPEEILDRINRLLIQQARDSHEVSIFSAQCDRQKGEMYYASAGGLACTYIDCGGKTVPLTGGVPPVGRFRETTFGSKILEVSTGGILVFHDEEPGHWAGTKDAACLRVDAVALDDSLGQHECERLRTRVETYMALAEKGCRDWRAIEFTA